MEEEAVAEAILQNLKNKKKKKEKVKRKKKEKREKREKGKGKKMRKGKGKRKKKEENEKGNAKGKPKRSKRSIPEEQAKETNKKKKNPEEDPGAEKCDFTAFEVEKKAQGSVMKGNTQFKTDGVDTISFWSDWWCGEKALWKEFPRLYDMSQNKSGSIHSHICVEGGKSSWDLGFRRNLNDWEMDKVASLMETIGEPPCGGADEDLRFWTLDPNGKFSLRPFYCFQFDDHPNTVGLHHTERSASYSTKRVLTNRDKAKSSTLECAVEVQKNLDPGFPSFVKSFHPSDVSGTFRLVLSLPFCSAYLPKHNVRINLIDENREKHPVEYVVQKIEFAHGWKEFSIAHKLVNGDALVFQLIKPTEFQVYIVRANSMPETDGDIDLEISNSLQEQIDESCKHGRTGEESAERHQKTVSLKAMEQPEVGPSRSGSDKLGSDVLEDANVLAAPVEFNDIKSLHTFTIAVNGSIIDSELSELARSNYYELCRSQKAFLHENLRATINCKLAAGLISQMIIIANDIRTSKLSTSLDEFEEWNVNLGVFQKLGMNVGFLRARINKLTGLVHESEEGVDSWMCEEAIVGKGNVKEDIRKLKAKLVELKEAYKRFDTEIEYVEVKAEDYELKFQTEVDAP